MGDTAAALDVATSGLALPGGLDIRELRASDTQRWTDYVSRHPRASIYHALTWKTIVERSFGHHCPYLIAARGDAIVGVLPVVRIRSPLFGHYLVSLPYFNYGGVLADSPAVEAALLIEMASRGRDWGCSHFESRELEPRAVDWPIRSDKVVMTLTLPASSEELSRAIGAKLRAQIKRPLREGAEARAGGIDLLDDFYHVFSVNMRDLGTPVYSREFFALILQQLGGAAELVVVRIAGRPVAAAFLVHGRTQTEIPWASSLREFNRISVNMMLYWEVLKLTIEKGAQSFDFGRTTELSGTYRFKRQWGAEPQRLYWHYWLADGQGMPALNPSNPRYQLAINVWQRLPVALTRLIGPPIVKNLP